MSKQPLTLPIEFQTSPVAKWGLVLIHAVVLGMFLAAIAGLTLYEPITFAHVAAYIVLVAVSMFQLVMLARLIRLPKQLLACDSAGITKPQTNLARGGIECFTLVNPDYPRIHANALDDVVVCRKGYDRSLGRAAQKAYCETIIPSKLTLLGGIYMPTTPIDMSASELVDRLNETLLTNSSSHA